MNLPTGIAAFDERTGGLRAGGLYLLTGSADTAKFAFILQFLAEGLRHGETVALLSAAAPSSVLEEAEYYGFDLITPWHDGRCVLLGFKGEYPRRVVHTPDPNEAFAELEQLVPAGVSRIGVDPGSFLWSTRSGTSMAQGFADWASNSGATVAASLAAGLDDRPDPATEWVLQRASGVLHFARLSSGLQEVSVRRMTPPVASPGPVSLALEAGAGLVAPSGPMSRRRSDRAGTSPERVYLVQLGVSAPDDLAGWLGRDREIVPVRGGMELIQRLSGMPAGVVCIYVDRRHTTEAIELIRAARPLTSAALILLSDHELRSGDRATALDAGADDVLSDGIDFKELDARIRRALESTRRSGPATAEPAGHVAIEGMMDEAAFRSAIDDRLSAGSQFSLLLFDGPSGGELSAALLSSVRTDSGDLVGPLDGARAVLLQDARPQQAEAFLRRLGRNLSERGVDGHVEAEILACPEQLERIRQRVAG